jgi:hypothetical protein
MSTGGWPRPHFDVVLCALGATHSYLPREGQAQSVRFVCDGFEYERDVCQSVDGLKGKQIARERS